ncbi:M48 family metallopeptidase [Hydrocarboniphaga sp.]|uniref:M48 family metallopeptidase n=1 Tax=Hydrocarboniphaga sp. TaxID=2033016 RepID=UPI003D0F1278
MNPSDQLDLLFDSYTISERISAKSRSIRVEVVSSSEVVLVIPRFVSRQVAREFLRSREDWIRQKIGEWKLREARDAESGPSPQLRWDGNDLLPLRDHPTALKVIPAQVRAPLLRIEADTLSLFCSPSLLSHPAKLEKVLREALRKEAFNDAQKLMTEEAARLGVTFEGPRIADQKTLWGSCAPSGLISLSWRLVLTPPPVFRYVVIHELCHRVHLDHSERFWALVEKQMPDFERHRRWLREHGQRLHWYLPG